MVEQYGKHHSSVLAVQEVPREETSSYGIVSSSPWGERTARVTGIVEKPQPELAPSTQAVVGRYVLSPLVFDHLANIKPGAGGEIQLTDALARLISDEPVLAYQFRGTRYDCGSKIGYLQATVELALRHPDVGADFAAFLQRRERR
jgi:UTP--glucose-1-phosphate uridylyltransferase